MNENNENLNPTRSNINWALVDSLPMAAMPDDDSPELIDADLKRLQPFANILLDVKNQHQVIKIVRFKQRGVQIRQQLAQIRQISA